MTFGEKCRKLRTEKKLTQEETANAAGISRRTYIYYETGKKLPRTRAAVQRLAGVFGVDSNYLVVEDDDILQSGKPLSPDERVDAIIAELSAILNDESVEPYIKEKLCRTISDMCAYPKEKNANQKEPS